MHENCTYLQKTDGKGNRVQFQVLLFGKIKSQKFKEHFEVHMIP